MNSEAYFLAINGQQTGPFSFAQVQDMWRSGMISAQTLFWYRGERDWRPLGDMAAPPLQGGALPIGNPPMAVNAPPGYYPDGTGPYYYAAPPTSALAVTSLILALAGFMFIFFAWIPSVVLGHIALSRIRYSQGRLGGRGYAVAGLAISYLCLLAIVAVIGLVFSFSMLNQLNIKSSRDSRSVEATTPSPVSEADITASHDLARARQISMAIDKYVEDHDGMTPPDFDALFPKYLQDRAVLGEGEPGGQGTGFDYLFPNQKFEDLDGDKALMYGKKESANHKKVIIYGDDRAGFDWDDTHDPKAEASPSPGAASPSPGE